MKKILSLLLALTLMISNALAWGDVVDNADILTDDQEAQLLALMAQFRSSTGQDVAILSTDDFLCYDPVQFGAFYYDTNGFGMGTDDSGILLYADMHERMFVLNKSGKARRMIDEEKESTIISAAIPHMSKGDAFGAFCAALRKAQEFLQTQ